MVNVLLHKGHLATNCLTFRAGGYFRLMISFGAIHSHWRVFYGLHGAGSGMVSSLGRRLHRIELGVITCEVEAAD